MWLSRPMRFPLHPGERESQPAGCDCSKWYDTQKGAAPTNQTTEKAAERRCNRRSQGIPPVQEGKGPGYVAFGDETHNRCRRHRPEPAYDNSKQRAPNHQDGVVRRQANDSARTTHECRQTQEDGLSIKTPRHEGDKQACRDGENARDRNGLSSLSFTQRQFTCDGRQQANGQKL